MKKIIRLIFAVASLLITTSLWAQYDQKSNNLQSYTELNPYKTVQLKEPSSTKAKNVILMIGDGMGLNQVSAAWLANRGALNLDNFKKTGFSRTYAANKLITDSGASGTAMACGQKTNYHSIGVDIAGNELNSLTDLAHTKGLATAVVVTCGLTDATPAAFCASSIDRDLEEDIAADFLSCNVDFLLGGGRKLFNQRADQRNILNEMTQKGYTVTSTWHETVKINSGKVMAVLEDGQLPLYPERGTLFQDASMKALEFVGKNDKGFFAMLEGSRIDDCGHWNDLPKLIQEVFDFDQTIGKVLQWAENDGETLVIVLADHETGGLILLGGDIASGKVEGSFSTGGHSGIFVPVYAFGPGADQFTGFYENTEVFHRIAQLLDLK